MIVCGCSYLHAAGVALWATGEEDESHVFSVIEQIGLGRGKDQEEMCDGAAITCGLLTGAGSLIDPEGTGVRVQPWAEGGGKC